MVMDDKLKGVTVGQNVDIDEVVTQVGLSFSSLVDCADHLARNSFSEVTLASFNHKVKSLQTSWYDFGEFYKTEREERTKLRAAYKKERKKCQCYQKYITFLKENQESFAKLQLMYHDMKVLEEKCSVDKESQTHNPVSNLGQVQQTLNSIRTLVQRRELRHQENNEKIKKMSSKITCLEELNENLIKSLSNVKRTPQNETNSVKSASESLVRVEPRMETLKSEGNGQIALTKSEDKCSTATDKTRVKGDGSSTRSTYRSKDAIRKPKTPRRVDRSTTNTGCRSKDQSYASKLTLRKVEGCGKPVRRTGEKKEVGVLRKIKLEIEAKKKKIDMFCENIERTT